MIVMNYCGASTQCSMTPECRVQSIVVLELQTTTTKFAISPRLVTVTMDPFSWVAGTIDLIDVCARFAAFLKDFETAAANVDREIQTLSKDVDAVKLVTELINSIS